MGPTSPETTQRGPDRPESTPVGPGRPGFDPAVPGPSRRRSFDSPQRSSDHSSRQGGQTPPRKRRRLSGNSSDEDSSSQNRQQQDEDDNFRSASLDLLLNYINKKFPAASQYLVQPSSKWSHALLFPVFHQGKSLGEGVPRSSPQGSHKTGSSDSRLLQSPIRGPEGLWVLATHHRPVYPEHIHRVTTLPYGDSSVRPTLHSPRRLDDLNGSSGRLPSGSNPPGITSVSSLHYGRSPIPVQDTMLRANYCPSGLYEAHGSNIRHSPSLRYQDPPISRRLVDSSRIQDHLYSSKGQAPASVQGAGTTSESQKVITGPISGHDLSRNADPISLVHCETNRDKGSELPQYNRGVSLVPESPSSSLATSSGPPFVPYPSDEGRDAKNAITPASSQVQVELSRRLPSHSLRSSVPGGSSMVVLGDLTTAGRRSFPPSAGLELLLGSFRRRLGCNNGGTTSVRSVDSKPKAGVHHPQGDDGSTERPLGVQPAPQSQDDRPVLRQCHNSRISQAIGRHEVRGPVPQSKGDPPVGRIYTDHDPTPVHPGFSQYESGSPQSAQPGDRVRVDLFATSPTARLPVFFAPAWEPKATGVDAFPQPWDNLQAYAFPPIAIIRRVLLKLRASHHCDLTLITPFWPQREWFPDLLELLSDIPIEPPKRQDLLRQPHFHRFHENLQMLRLTAWRLSNVSHDKQASLKQWLANLPPVGEHLLD